MTCYNIALTALITLFGMFSLRSNCQIEANQSYNEIIPAVIVNTNARLKSFSADYSTGKVYLEWTIKNKTKVGTYIIERSADGISFQTIGIQQGIITVLRKNISYYFVDTDPLGTPLCYYRIKHFAIDNSLYTSEMIVMQ